MAEFEHTQIAAVVLAAGLSSRMGATKALLPWKQHRTVLAHILDQLQNAGLTHIVVVTGHQADQIEQAAQGFSVQFAHNADYANGEMLLSMQVGLRELPENITAALIVLSDQPQIQAPIAAQIIQAYMASGSQIVIPSFEMRRGHPMLIARQLWPEILALPAGAAARDVINRHASEIQYVTVENDSVLRDMDTPQDYADERKRAGLE